MKVKSRSSAMKAVREFTDREEPRASFWKAYQKVKEQMTSDEPDITVLAYYGIGGIGKSTLLRKLISELEEQETAPLYVKYDLNDQQECRAVLDRIKNVLAEKYKFHFPLFELGSFVYAKKMGEKADQQEVRQIAEKSPVLSVLLQATEVIPVVGIAAKVLSIADQSVAHLRTHLNNHRPELMQIEGLEPDELYAQLPYLFAQDMTANLEKHRQPMVIFLDTYEKLVNELCQTGEPLKFDEWLRGEDGLVQNIPHVLWVIAGREKLKWERFDADWSEALEQHILGNLSFADSDSFLRKAGVENDDLRAQLYELTHGTPVYLDLCVDQYCRFVDKGVTPAREMFGDNTYDLIERFVRYMTDTQKDMVYMLACLQSWDDALIERIGGQIVPGFSITVYEKTKEYSFVLPKDDGSYSIHQTVGEILRDACPSILRKRAGAALRECYAATLAERRVLSDEFAVALTCSARAALLEYDEDEALCDYFNEHIREPLLDFIKAARYQQAATLLDLFFTRAAPQSHLRVCLLALMSHTSRLAGDFKKALALGKEAEMLGKQVLGDNHPDTLKAMKYVSDALYKLGQYAESRAYDETVLAKTREVLGEDHPDTLSAMNGLAVSIGALGDKEESLHLMRIIYEKRRALLGDDHPDTLLSMANLACSIRETGDYATARDLQETVLAARRVVFGEDHPDTLVIMNSLAVTYGYMGDHRKEREMKELVLAKRREIFGEDHPDTWSAMNSLACVLDDLGEYAQARALYEEVLKRRLAIFGEDHPQTWVCMNNLAVTLENMREYAAARELKETVLEKRRKFFGDDHPDTLSSMNNLATVLSCMQEYAVARALKETVLEKRRRILGEDHPDTLSAMNNLACTLDDLGEYAAARTLYEETLERRRRILGEDHPDTLLTMNNLAITLDNLREYAAARELKEIVLEKRRRVLGENHPDTLATMNNLACTLDDLGEYAAARTLYEETLERRRRVLGDDHPDTLATMNNLAITLDNMHEYAAARELKETVLEKRRRILGDDHPHTLSAMNNLAFTLDNMRDYAAARALYKELFERRCRILGNDHPSTLSTMNNLATACYCLRDYAQAQELYEGLLERRRRVLGEDHPDTLSAMNNVIASLRASGQYAASAPLCEELLARQRAVYGEEDARTKRTEKWLHEACNQITLDDLFSD